MVVSLGDIVFLLIYIMFALVYVYTQYHDRRYGVAYATGLVREDFRLGILWWYLLLLSSISCLLSSIFYAWNQDIGLVLLYISIFTLFFSAMLVLKVSWLLCFAVVICSLEVYLFVFVRYHGFSLFDHSSLIQAHMFIQGLVIPPIMSVWVKYVTIRRAVSSQVRVPEVASVLDYLFAQFYVFNTLDEFYRIFLQFVWIMLLVSIFDIMINVWGRDARVVMGYVVSPSAISICSMLAEIYALTNTMSSLVLFSLQTLLILLLGKELTVEQLNQR